MKDTMTDEELGEAISRIVQKENKKRATPGEPRHTLEEMLSSRSATALKTLAKIHRVKGYTKMDKPALVSGVSARLTNLDWLKEVFCILHEIEWEFFQETVAVRQLQKDSIYIDSYQTLQDFGFLSVYWYENKLYFVVPEEIRAIYDEIKTTSFPAERDYCWSLNQYAIAAANLYGVISQDDFVALFNRQNTRKTSIDEMFPILLKYSYLGNGYCFWEEYIVNEDFEDNDYLNVERYAREAASKPRYLPPREEFLRYADWDYYEITPQIEALECVLEKKLRLTPDDAGDILDEVHVMYQGETDLRFLMNVFTAHGISIPTRAVAQELVTLVTDMGNNTRMWLNNGHTPDELFQRDAKHLRPLPAAKPAAVGRNDPCPCGSGKKYKKCCYLIQD
ncbi:MAG: SEC-C domain-containing protein [Oscillospiraceae bacterium]|jgi:hypothetical protein|nr:SEC-C domain-containing protein [Oscillospiraceae bacterium]